MRLRTKVLSAGVAFAFVLSLSPSAAAAPTAAYDCATNTVCLYDRANGVDIIKAISTTEWGLSFFPGVILPAGIRDRADSIRNEFPWLMRFYSYKGSGDPKDPNSWKWIATLQPGGQDSFTVAEGRRNRIDLVTSYAL